MDISEPKVKGGFLVIENSGDDSAFPHAVVDGNSGEILAYTTAENARLFAAARRMKELLTEANGQDWLGDTPWSREVTELLNILS